MIYRLTFFECACVCVCVFILSSCSTTHKITSAEAQKRIDTVLDTNRHTNLQSNAESAVRTTEIDLSNVIIDFTKVEYADYTSPSIVNDSSDINQINRKLRYGQTELSSGNRPIKSILLGRATINNNNRTQTDIQTTSADVSQINESKAITTTTQTATSQKIEEKPKRNIFRTFALISLLSVIVFIGYEYWRCKKD